VNADVRLTKPQMRFFEELKQELAKLGMFARFSILMAAMGECLLGIARPEGSAPAAIWLVLGTLVINLVARLLKIH